MKLDRKFVQELAEGMHSQYDSIHGEVRKVARRIIEENLMTRFSKFSFMQNGKTDIDPSDVFDTFVDFGMFGAELRIACDKDVHPNGIKQVFGMTPEDSLKKLFMETIQDERLRRDLYGREFTIRGEKGRFQYHPTLFHYCFAKGRLSGKELLKKSRVA